MKINNRDYVERLPLNEECNFPLDRPTFFELSNLTAIKVLGEKSREFLQGQLTCDVREINETNIKQGALCDLKGRIQALLDVAFWRDFFLVLPKDLLESTLHTLSKTAIVSRVKLTAINDYNFFGLFVPKDNILENFPFSLPKYPLSATQQDDFYCYALDSQRFIIITTSSKARCFSQITNKGDLGWHRISLENFAPEIYPETKGLFLPHRLELHKKGFISFNKGCYKGQEIIARMHYKGKIKHSLKKFYAKPSDVEGVFLLMNEVEAYDISHNQMSLFSGAQLLHPDTKTELGELIDFCPVQGGNYLILVSILHEISDNAMIALS